MIEERLSKLLAGMKEAAREARRGEGEDSLMMVEVIDGVARLIAAVAINAGIKPEQLAKTYMNRKETSIFLAELSKAKLVEELSQAKTEMTNDLDKMVEDLEKRIKDLKKKK